MDGEHGEIQEDSIGSEIVRLKKDTKKYFTNQIYEIWMPAAIRYEISLDVFWHLNPHIMSIYQQEFIRKKKAKDAELDYMAYISGIYTMKAVSANFGGRYPEKPLYFFREEEKKQEFTEADMKKSANEMMLWAMMLKKDKVIKSKSES